MIKSWENGFDWILPTAPFSSPLCVCCSRLSGLIYRTFYTSLFTSLDLSLSWLVPLFRIAKYNTSLSHVILFNTIICDTIYLLGWFVMIGERAVFTKKKLLFPSSVVCWRFNNNNIIPYIGSAEIIYILVVYGLL